MDKRAFIIVGAIIVAFAVWALFRPELLFINKSVSEAPPASITPASAQNIAGAVLTGKFHGVAHDTTGVASIYELGGGKRVLRLTGFETSNGPDLRVLLVAAADASDNQTVKNNKPVELGSLKGNIGDQNYELQAGLDLSKYRAVTIWCNRFSVNFGTAALMGSGSRS